jgi:predicted membrane channel-forming protein YqfA (hemolysin III family)
MLVFAVETGEKLRNVPLKSLAYLGLGVLALAVIIFLIKKAAGVNRIFLILIGGMVIVVLTMTWVYDRNEPKFFTPFVDKIAPFFPNTPPPISSRPNPGDPSGSKKSAAAPATPSSQKPVPVPEKPDQGKTPPAKPAPSKVY